MVICYLGVGTNLGNRKKNIELAVEKINASKDTRIMRISKLFDFAPVGGPKGQRNYLNAVLKVQTRLSPLRLLKQLKKIEIGLGRVKTLRFGPRVIDLDILLYADRLIKSKALTVPHPRMFTREFVIRPLIEIL